jgi:hypothetical protein
MTSRFPWAELDPQRNTPELPIVKFPSRRVPFTLINFNLSPSRRDNCSKGIKFSVEPRSLLFGGLDGDADRDDDGLDIGDSRGNHQPPVITVNDNHNANNAMDRPQEFCHT